MLKTRVLTAVAIAPLFYALLFMTTPDQFGLIMAVILMIGCWEFRKLASLVGGVSGWLLMALQAGIFVLLYKHREAIPVHAGALLMAGCLVWLVMFLRMVMFRAGDRPDFQYRIVTFFCAIAALSACWIGLFFLVSDPSGSWWILLMFLVIWASDTGAYFAGRAWGRKRMSPHISPKKTWVGFFGGLASAVIVALMAALLVPALEVSPTRLICVSLVTAIASVGGDLFISMHKRIVAVKDSGRIFPGHGGVLDRFDSLLTGAPFMAVGKLILDLLP